jgi:ion channel
VEPSPVQQVVVSSLVGGSLLLAFWAAGVRKRWLLGALVLAVTVVALSLVRAITGGIGDGASRTMNGVLVALGPPAIAVGVVRNLRATGGVRIEAVMGVLSFYMLLGMLFAFAFGAIDNFGGHPFFASGASATVSNCLYFSFTTLATVGYGDLTARTNLGHTLSILEALIGQIYLVTVVSLIVSNLRRPAAPEPAPPTAD